MELSMSWQPTNDPVLGDPKSCDALELVIVPRTRDLGDGFEVRRALPHGKRQMVGPFIFFDHFGPVQFIAGKGMDVRPHPHIGLATVTYLFDGSIMHRDSEGNIQEIQPGAMNLMTAGRGIAHSERTPDVQRRDGQKMLGLQSWIALPAASEEIAPSFQHHSAEHLPVVSDNGFTARIIAGSSFGAKSPVTTRWKVRATSGGISCLPARSGSSRPNRTGKPAVLTLFRRSMSLFRCRSELSPLYLSLRSRLLAPAPPESMT
jgi:redox-sensitive bicupin YhaK (pirin superfamily)